MEEELIIERVDIFLERMCNGPGFDDIGSSYFDLFDLQGRTDGEYRIIMDRMESEMLAYKLGDNGTRMGVTDFGRRVYQAGGYIELLVQKNIESKEKEEEQKLNTEIARQQFKLNDWYIKSRWWPHIISVIALLLSLKAIFAK